jgi:alkanesulfonate monooxygenase SsuD/methylene tetrahydromethanopterin reductase-like flavin-dependent oxidoreductase (luciferase family)
VYSLRPSARLAACYLAPYSSRCVRGVEHLHGIEFPPAGECGHPKALAELARLAEEPGWDSVFLEDYLVNHNATYRSVSGTPTHDPWVCLAAMATRTERVRLGTAVTALPRRSPGNLPERWSPWTASRRVA